MHMQEKWPQWPIWNTEEISMLTKVIESGRWSYNGPMEQQAKDVWCEYINVPYTYFVSNGTVSIQLALEALGIGYGDEVLVPGITWQATAAAVVDVNAVPVIVDVDPESWCIDPQKAEAAITPRTRAIIPVHLYGSMANMDAITELAKKYHLFIIEDAAHKQGGKWRDTMAGAIGDIGSFSLQQSKVLTTGEGGILTTSNPTIAEKIDALRNCGRKPINKVSDAAGGQYGEIGDFIQSGNYRITEMQAALFITQFSRLAEQNKIRSARAALLDNLLQDIDGITIMKQDPRETQRVYFNYAFSIEPQVIGMDAKNFRETLSERLGFEASCCYQPLNNCSLYRPLTKKRHHINKAYMEAIDPSRFSLPIAEDIYHNRAVTFPHRILLSSERQMYLIADTIRNILSPRG